MADPPTNITLFTNLDGPSAGFIADGIHLTVGYRPDANSNADIVRNGRSKRCADERPFLIDPTVADESINNNNRR